MKGFFNSDKSDSNKGGGSGEQLTGARNGARERSHQCQFKSRKGFYPLGALVEI